MRCNNAKCRKEIGSGKIHIYKGMILCEDCSAIANKIEAGKVLQENRSVMQYVKPKKEKKRFFGRRAK